MKIRREKERARARGGPKKVCKQLGDLGSAVEIGILLPIFGGKMSEKSVAVVVRSHVPREYREV